MLLNELLKGLDTTKNYTVDEIVKLINTTASELKAKVLIDDGKEDVFIPKARLDEEISKKKTIQATLDSTNKDLEEIKKSAGDNKGLTEKIEALQNGNKELDDKLKNQTLETHVKLKAIELKSKDKSGNVILKLVDKSKMKLNDDGTVTGLDEEMKRIAEAEPYLFDSAEEVGGTGKPGAGGKGGSNSPSEGIGEKLAKQNVGTNPQDTQNALDSYFK